MQMGGQRAWQLDATVEPGLWGWELGLSRLEGLSGQGLVWDGGTAAGGRGGAVLMHHLAAVWVKRSGFPFPSVPITTSLAEPYTWSLC